MICSQEKFNTWLPALFDGQFHWDFLRPCFKGTRIMPMDFDAVVERRGHTAIFETKDAGKKIDVGQAITLTNEWSKGSTIFHVQGKTPKEIQAFRIYAQGNFTPGIQVGDWLPQKGDAYDLVYRVRCWFCWSSGEKVPTREDWDHQLWLWDYDKTATRQA